MPRSLDPNATNRITLDCDADRDPQQVFVFRCLSMGQERELATMLDREFTKVEEFHDVLIKRIMLHLLDWELTDQEGKPIPFDADSAEVELDRMLSTNEASELAAKLMEANRITNDEKKSAASPASSDTACCANTACPDSATPPKPPNESASNAPTVTVLDAKTANEEHSN